MLRHLRPHLALALAMAAPLAAQDAKVLFLGNSYTSVNDLPEVFAKLATSGGHTVVTGLNAPGGFTLGSPQSGDPPHRYNVISLNLIASDDWDFVVLQEQSVTPAIEFTKNEYMLPAVIALDAAIKANDPATKTLLYQTWARKDPGIYCWGASCSPDFPTFHAMQDALTAGYEEAADEIGALVSPVGEAWRIARVQHPSINLFDPDGTHPSAIGTYLNACVFYAKIFGESPVGLSFGMAAYGPAALTLQEVAAEAVLGVDCGFGPFGGVGTLNPLLLDGSGEPSLGGTVHLSTSELPDASTGAFVLSSSAPLSTPFLGGELLVDPARRLLPPRFVGAGKEWTIRIPEDPELTGFSVYFQAIALVAGPSPTGAVLSRGLRLRICP